EMIAILDRAAVLKLNAVVLQVRPECDAIYASSIEPWSLFLTGKMGREPGYDPLAFAVAEAHKRGLELHAWINPFRALLKARSPVVSTNHVVRRHPEWIVNYGSLLWLNPGEPAVREYVISVMRDIVKRYDVDGIHMDDYFYPYPENDGGKPLEFHDGSTFRHYRAEGGKLTLSDWRRENINEFVRSAYFAVKKEKPWVKFGISPFGIWQPGHPRSVKGMNSYETLS